MEVPGFDNYKYYTSKRASLMGKEVTTKRKYTSWSLHTWIMKQNLKGLIPDYVSTFWYMNLNSSSCFSTFCIVVVMDKMWVRRYSMIKEDPDSKLQKRQYMKLQLGQKA